MYIRKVSLLLILIQSLLYSLPTIDFRVNNNILKQYRSDLNENRRRLKVNESPLPLQFYKYNITPEDTIFTVSSRFNLNYDTIATLNSIENQLFFKEYKHILIPNCLGTFSTKRKSDIQDKIILEGKVIYFTPGLEMSKKERVTFLISPFSSPLKKMKITSPFGHRENPFSGKSELHPGIDLKAKVGTKIYSPYAGVIKVSSYSDFLGNYLIIDHGMGYTSHYYHLKSVKFKKGYKLKQGEHVAYTGNSGRSTGPHLHFEIRKEDEVLNPVTLLGDI